MYCSNCGREIDDKAVICVGCGAQVNGGVSNGGVANKSQADKPMIILDIVCFFVPLVGLILYLTMKNDTPISAKAYGKWALIGLIVGIVLTIVGIVVGCTAFGIFADSYGNGFDGFDTFDNLETYDF